VDDLTIDREFQSLLPALDEDEAKQLEANLLADGFCRDPIITWANHDDTVIEGHHRYKICRKHKIKFTVKAIKLPTRDDVKNWILGNQLGRRNLKESQRAYFAAQMVTTNHGGSRGGQEANLPLETTVDDAAKNGNVSARSVRSAKKVIEDGAKPLQNAVRDGEIPVSTAAAVAELPKAEQAKLVAKGPEAVAAKAKALKANGRPKQHKDTFDPKEIEAAAHKKNGAESSTQFKDKSIDDGFQSLIKLIDKRWNLVGGHALKHRILVGKMREAFDAWSSWKSHKE